MCAQKLHQIDELFDYTTSIPSGILEGDCSGVRVVAVTNALPEVPGSGWITVASGDITNAPLDLSGNVRECASD